MVPAICVLLFIGLLVLSVPIAFSFILTLLSYFLINGQPQFLPVIAQKMGNALDSFTLLAVPLFLLAGNLMAQSGMAERLTRFALALMGRTPGGLAQASVVSNIIMAGMSGSATADAAATGAIFIPLMKQAGYGRGFSAAAVAAPAMIGPIIPPASSWSSMPVSPIRP